MKLNYKIILIIPFIFFIVILLQNKSFAQQTIFNVPSADITEKGMIFFQHESQFSDDFGLFTNYGAYGIGKNTEIDITLFEIGTHNVRNENLAIGFKKVFPLHEKSETKLTIGHLIPVSLRGNGVGGYTYSHLSTRLPKIKTRITSGFLVGTTTILGRDFICYIGGIEQPVTKRFSLIADWHSGKHAYGFLISGFSYIFNPSLTLYAGYQIRNNRANGPNGFVIELAKIF